MKKHNIINHRKGSALVFVLITFLIIMILSTSVIFLFSSNHKQALKQEENIREHYLLVSAIDVAISTLLSPLYINAEGKEKTMVDKIRDDKKSITLDKPLKDEIIIDGQKVEIQVLYDKDRQNEFLISSRVIYETSFSKELSLTLEFIGRDYKKKWK